MKDKIAKWFKQNLWSFEMVKNAVKKNVVTEDEFKEITGEDYPITDN